MRKTAPILALAAIFSLASTQAAVQLVDTDSATTAANSAPGDFTLSDQGPGTRDGIYSYNYNAGASFDMLVVSVSREASSPEIFSVSYDGVDMDLATGTTTGSGVSIFYLETAASSGTIALDFSTFATVNGIGIGIVAIKSDNGNPIELIDADFGTGTSITLDPTLDGSFTMFAIDTNLGAFSGLNTPPLTQIYANEDVGSNGAGAAYDTDVAAGNIIYSYTNTASPRGIGAANFATVTPPLQIISTDPIDDSTGVYPGGDLVATFNLDIALTGSGTITLTDITSSTDNRTINLPNAGVTVSGDQLTIDLSALDGGLPTDNLDFSTEYEITIDGSAVEDLSANAFAGTSSGDWTFTSAAQNLTAPTVSTTNPGNGDTDVPLETDIVVTFDQDILAGTGSITFTGTGVSVPAIDVTDTSQVSFAGNVMTISPTGLLTLGATHTVTLPAGIVKNYSDVVTAAPDYSWSFTATTSGTITWLADADGNWSDSGNWSYGIVPDGDGVTAEFSTEFTDARTVTLDSNRTVSDISFTDTTSSHDLTISGGNTLTLTDSADSPEINVTQADRKLSIDSAIAGTQGLAKTGPGTLALGGTNTYSGVTTLGEGTLIAGSASALGSGGDITFAGGTLRFASNYTTSQAVTNSGGSTMNLIANTGVEAILNGVIDSTNTGGLIVSGNGTLTLGGSTNAFTGGITTVKDSNTTLKSTDPGALAGNAISLRNNTTLMLVGAGALGTSSVDGNANGDLGSLHFQVDGGDTVTNAIQLSRRSVNPVITLDRETQGAADNWVFTNTTIKIAQNSTMTWKKGANVTSGTPTCDMQTAFTQSESTSNQEFPYIAESVDLGINGITTNNQTRIWVLDGATFGNNVYGKMDQNDTTTCSVVKRGSGTWTISSTNNDYTGTTTVEEGTLLITGQTGPGSAVTVQPAAVLGGNGTILGDIVVQHDAVDGTGGLAPGTSVGVTVPVGSATAAVPAGTLSVTGNVNVSALAGQGAGTLAFELDALASDSDQIDMTDGSGTGTGVLSIGSGALRFSDFTFTDLGGLQAGTYTLIKSDNAVSGTVDGSNASGSIGAFTGTLQVSGSGTDLELVVTGAGGGSPYTTWSSGAPFDGDANVDGVQDGLAFLLGVPTLATDANSYLPTVTEDGSGGLVLTFDMLDSASRGTATLYIEHSSDLGIGDAWTTVAVPDSSGGPTSGVTFSVSGSGTLDVTATIGSAEAASGKLFGRVSATE